MRYVGQNWELDVALEGEVGRSSVTAAEERFHREHEAQFGWNLPDGDLELVNFKLVATVTRPKARLPELDNGPPPEPVGQRLAAFEGERARVDTPVLWREDLHKGNRIEGQAIVAEIDSTVLLQPGDSLEGRPLRKPAYRNRTGAT